MFVVCCFEFVTCCCVLFVFVAIAYCRCALWVVFYLLSDAWRLLFCVVCCVLFPEGCYH